MSSSKKLREVETEDIVPKSCCCWDKQKMAMKRGWKESQNEFSARREKGENLCRSEELIEISGEEQNSQERDEAKR